MGRSLPCLDFFSRYIVVGFELLLNFCGNFREFANKALGHFASFLYPSQCGISQCAGTMPATVSILTK
jgi:hypothetical protein